MDKNVLQQASQIQRKRKRRKTWKTIVTCLGAIVVFATTYSLILPAITMETKLICGKEEHLHSDACYETVLGEATSAELICLPEAHTHTEECRNADGALICGKSDLLIHTHNEFCYHNEQLICPLDQQAGHLHTDACYTADAVLICGLDGTEGHVHTEECAEVHITLICVREQVAVHTHSESCMDETGAYICGILSAEEHIHGQECLSLTAGTETSRVLSCQAEEHTHTEDCVEHPVRTDTIPDSETFCGYIAHAHGDTCRTLICGETDESHEHGETCYDAAISCEIAEHVHTLACRSDPTADTETQADWESSVSGVTLTGNAPADLLAVARSQLGISESELNFAVAEDGVTKLGYNRYGAWFGAPYSPWNTLFLSFCAQYAGVDAIPLTTNPETVVTALQADETALYHGAGDYTPSPGDLVFFDTDGDGLTDRLGIVEACSVPNLTLQTIEGDADGQVAQITYTIPVNGIAGYGQLAPAAEPVTENPTEPEQEPEDPTEPEAPTDPADPEPESETPPVTHSVINQEGTLMYHAPNYIEYQYSSHRVNNFMTLTYVLIPYADYSENWQPSTLQWTANAGANYVVAYCADRNTDISETGAMYTTKEIRNSDYAHCATVLAGVVEHAYPFISAEEMRQQLAAAYQTGEISVDLSCCTESEFIAAGQWAVWDASGLSGTQTTAAGSEFPSYNAYAMNPLTDSGHTDDATVQSHVKAIRDWLMTRRAPDNLTVSHHEAQVTRRADGTYDMTATLFLARPLADKEVLLVDFLAGDRKESSVVSGAGLTQFTVSLSGLTAEEVLNASVRAEVHFEHMEVYIYDSGDWQDMISGQWGETVYTLSVGIKPDTTSVSVRKHWTGDDISVDTVSVQLYADGKQYGSPAVLSAANGWSFTWDTLLKYSAAGVPIEYTVKEVLVPGYLSSVSRLETVVTMDSSAAFREGAEYVLTYGGTNALGDSGSGLYWQNIKDPASPGAVVPAARWIATGVSADGSSAYLQNTATGNYLYYDGTYITLSASPAAKTYFLYNRLYLLKGDVNQYLIYLDGGSGYAVTDWDRALNVSLWNYGENGTADLHFLITNTKTEEHTSVSVTKEWAGRDDGNYPESAEVYLLQNGEPYGASVILNAENGWTYLWENLPLKSGDTEFVYTVEEVRITGYTASAETVTDESGAISFTLCNTWSPEYLSLILAKVDSNNLTHFLPGAQFQLYLTDTERTEGAVTVPYTDVPGILLDTVTVGEDGTFLLKQLLAGETYYLVETLAPTGYLAPDEAIAFTVETDENGQTVITLLSGASWATVSGENTLLVKNPPAYKLPATGGPGTYLYTLGGLLLILAAAAILLYSRIPRRKEDIPSS